MRGDPIGLIILLFLIGAAIVAWAVVSRKFLREELERQLKNDSRAQKEIAARDQQLADFKANLDKAEASYRALEQLMRETSTFYPSLAKAIADQHYLESHNLAYRLANKKHPALVKAEEVKAIARERREAERLHLMLKYQLTTYEALFPWLVDYSGRSTEDLINEWKRRQEGVEPTGEPSVNEPERDWLDPDEYAKLSEEERADLALNRWRQAKRRKTSWEAGRDYERYVGYMLEKEGYDVDYWGATEGLEDMGRDIIASKGKLTRIVQCKWWNPEKRIIHEKHIFQLIGTAFEYVCSGRKLQFKGLDLQAQGIVPVLATTTRCSDTARKAAETLGVELMENYQMTEYPIVKCNISGRAKEKIYHLPFDQQYDRIKITPGRDERYASSAEEAKRLGFRRAHRHMGRV